MAKGRQGFLLEGWKFAVYLAIPIAASMYFNNLDNQRKAADYWQYIRYPANPSTGWKEQIELMRSQKEQREAYRQQLQQLNGSTTTTDVESGSDRDGRTNDDSSESGWRLLRWIGLGPKES